MMRCSASSHRSRPARNSAGRSGATRRTFDGPPELEAFLRKFGHLAESDDVLRNELANRLTRTERAEFIKRVEPLFPAINAYLASLKGPWSAQAIDLAQLGELGSELIVAR